MNHIGTIRHWVAAARYLYDLSPERYAANGHGNVLLKNVKTLIQPGVRAGEPVATSQDKDDIFHLAMQCGREQFRSFAAWVNVPLST